VQARRELDEARKKEVPSTANRKRTEEELLARRHPGAGDEGEGMYPLRGALLSLHQSAVGAFQCENDVRRDL
jgi:hypothetical protein